MYFELFSHFSASTFPHLNSNLTLRGGLPPPAGRVSSVSGLGTRDAAPPCHTGTHAARPTPDSGFSSWKTHVDTDNFFFFSLNTFKKSYRQNFSAGVAAESSAKSWQHCSWARSRLVSLDATVGCGLGLNVLINKSVLWIIRSIVQDFTIAP